MPLFFRLKLFLAESTSSELSHITPHQLRHTFCNRMARAGMSPAKLRYIMGHSDISTTYNVYTHLGLEDIQDEMLAIEQNRM